jgi:hypothetical protein
MALDRIRNLLSLALIGIGFAAGLAIGLWLS